MCYVSAHGVDERMLNVHYHYYYLDLTFDRLALLQGAVSGRPQTEQERLEEEEEDVFGVVLEQQDCLRPHTS